MSDEFTPQDASCTAAGDDLTRLKWVGQRLAAHLQTAGFTSYALIAGAAPEALAALPGINRKHLPELISSATELLKNDTRQERITMLRLRNRKLQKVLETVGETARTRFAPGLQKESGAKLERELVRLTAALTELDGQLDRRLKRTGKQLDKVERHLDLAQEYAGLKALRKQLKKSRQAVMEIIDHDHA